MVGSQPSDAHRDPFEPLAGAHTFKASLRTLSLFVGDLIVVCAMFLWFYGFPRCFTLSSPISIHPRLGFACP